MARTEALMPARSRHLRLVAPTERAESLAQAEAASRRAVALLVGSTVFLTSGGLIMVLSASSISAYTQYGSSFVFFERQAAYAGVGALALLLTSRMRYEVWQRLAVPFLALTVGLLALVLHSSSGVEAYGASRWIALGPITIQPSEVAKLALIVFAATVLARKWGRLDEIAHLALPLVPVTVLVAGMIMAQPDLGTTLILVGCLFLLLFAAGVKLRYLIVSATVSGAVGLALIFSEGYRRTRFLSFLHPSADPLGAGYQLKQSLIALGSGGWFGVGLGASRQKWMYVPNAHTDFIFSILGEELGLVGELVVLAAFGVLIYSGIRIAVRAPDVFGRLLAAGIVSWFGLQIVLNLGAVTGLLPITGVPLPMLSYGGSSLVASLAAVGILVNVARAPARAGRAGRRRRSPR